MAKFAAMRQFERGERPAGLGDVVIGETGGADDGVDAVRGKPGQGLAGCGDDGEVDDDVGRGGGERVERADDRHARPFGAGGVGIDGGNELEVRVLVDGGTDRRSHPPTRPHDTHANRHAVERSPVDHAGCSVRVGGGGRSVGGRAGWCCRADAVAGSARRRQRRRSGRRRRRRSRRRHDVRSVGGGRGRVLHPQH